MNERSAQGQAGHQSPSVPSRRLSVVADLPLRFPSFSPAPLWPCVFFCVLFHCVSIGWM